MITPHQIAVPLGKICRWGGRGKFASDLLHCIVVAMLLPAPIQIHGLLHDAAEIKTGDCNGILKTQAFRKAELRILQGMYAEMNLPFPSAKAQALIKIADNRSRNAEVWTGIGDTKLRGTYSVRDEFAERLTLKLYRKFPPADCITDGKAVAEYVRLFRLYKAQL